MLRIKSKNKMCDEDGAFHSSIGNPRNRKLNRRSFTASYAENKASVGATGCGDRGTEDSSERRKRVRFAQGAGCSLESESNDKARLNDAAEGPKTSEYAFFKRLRQNAVKIGLPANEENKTTGECESNDDSDIAGVGNIISQSFKNLKSSLHPQDARPRGYCSLLLPIADSSKKMSMKCAPNIPCSESDSTCVISICEMNSLAQPDYQNLEFSHPTKKAVHGDFEMSGSPFRDRVRSSVASYVYGQGNFFTTKREKLLQFVANTYPESKDCKMNRVDHVNLMLGRLFPNGYDSKHAHRPCELRHPDSCTSWSPGFLENNADCERFHWSGRHSLREAGDMMLLDYGCTTSGSTELAEWSGNYNMSPDMSSDDMHNHIHYKMNKAYHVSDYERSKRPLRKNVLYHLPCQALDSPKPSDIDIVTHHLDDLPSGQNLLLGWVDERTEDVNQLQIAPYKSDYDICLQSNCQTLWKNDYQLGLGANIDFSVSRIFPQSVPGHYASMTTNEETGSYVESDHIEDRENKSWDIIHPHSLGSHFTNKDGDINLPYSHLLLGTPNIFGAQEIIPSDYRRQQTMCIDEPWEVCKKESHLSRSWF